MWKISFIKLLMPHVFCFVYLHGLLLQILLELLSFDREWLSKILQVFIVYLLLC